MFIAEALFLLSLVILFYTYLGYPCLLACCNLFCSSQSSKPDDAHCPTVSIVLAAYNESNHIRQKLENCLSLDYPSVRLEIIVGSDGSDDGTDDMVAEYQDRGIKLLSFRPRCGKMATVNRIVKKATGEICVFSDISELFDRDAIRKLVQHFADPEIGAVCGNHIYNPENSSIGMGTIAYWKFKRFQQGIESRLDTICKCDGTIYACRRELFPYPPDPIINDDVAVPLGIITRGKRIIFEPEAIIRGNVVSAAHNYFRQKVRSQAGQYQIFAIFREMFIPWPLLRWWIFISHTVLPVLVPWFIISAFVTNVVLWITGHWVYQILMGLQLGFYVLAFTGWVTEKLGFHISFLSIPFYFMYSNIGSVCGFFAFISGRQGAAWRKVE